MIAQKADTSRSWRVPEFAGHRRRNRLTLSVTLFVAIVATLSMVQVGFAGPTSSEREPLATEQVGESELDYNGEDFTRPESKIIMRFEGRTSGATTKTERETLFLQGEVAYYLKSEWRLDGLIQLPVVSKSVTGVGPIGSTHEFGLGDTEVQVVLARPISERWGSGFGVRLITPSAQGRIGNGKWQMLPGFGLRYSFLEHGPNTYFVPKLRYALSVGGDQATRNISELQIAPTLSIGLPNRWFVLLYPSFDIRINFGDPILGQVGRLFLPIDVAVGRRLSDNFVMTLEVGKPVIKDFPVYVLKAELKILSTF
jgi:hypothetical protein